MGNPTAYPICTLLEKLPLIKTRVLKEDEANQDGIARTCAALARRYPEFWGELWQSSPHRRLWQESISVAIVLNSSDCDVLADRINWVKQHPHPKLMCCIAIHASESRRRAQLMKEHKQDIEGGLLSIVLCECDVESDQALLQILASSCADWVTISTKDFWRDFASLQLQLHLIAKQPSIQAVDGLPRLWKRELLFDIDQLTEFKDYSSAHTP